MAPHTLEPDSLTKMRIGIPDSEEYEKMVAELPLVDPSIEQP
jgi:hypothetical protein